MLKYRATPRQNLQEFLIRRDWRQREGGKDYGLINSQSDKHFLLLFLFLQTNAEIYPKIEQTHLLSLVARRMVNAVIWVAVFHFPKLFTATAWRKINTIV